MHIFAIGIVLRSKVEKVMQSKVNLVEVKIFSRSKF